MDGPLIAGRYRRGSRLGVGGMASVWGARDERTGTDVAIKMLHPHLAGDDRQRKRLRQEASALATIDDEHVVPVLDVIDDDDSPAIVMPLVDGETLADRLARDGTLDETTALDIGIAIAEALAAAHGVGLVHRDVKPSNILLGSDGIVRLMDFGIATDLDATSELTADGVIGTLRYLAPERLLGEPAVPATDVWGVGVVLVEMLAGRPAYPGSSLDERLDAAAGSVERPPGVASRTWEVIRRAADGDVRARYPDGAALLAALRGARSHLGGVDPDAATVAIPVTGHADQGERQPAPPPLVRRGRPPAVAAAVLIVASLGLAAMAAVAMDPGVDRADAGSTRTDVPAVAPAVGTPTPAPTPTVTPAATAPVVADRDRDGDGKGKGKGNGKGKGHGKDKP